MNAVPILLLYMVSKMGKGGSSSQPSWPRRSDPPPRRAHKPRPHHAKPSGKGAPPPPEKKPVEHTESEHHDSPAHSDKTDAVIHHPDKPRGTAFKNLDFSQAHMDDVHQEHHEPKHAATHVEDHQHTSAPAVDQGAFPVSNIQSILRALGWKGHLTTKGPVSPALTDGDFGPVTRDDWQQSARKRNLDPTFVRLDGQHVHVDPRTYATLLSIAKEMSHASVVGSRRSRSKLYIPR